jgi:hypothetical protein
VNYLVKDQGDHWAVVSHQGRLYRALINPTRQTAKRIRETWDRAKRNHGILHDNERKRAQYDKALEEFQARRKAIEATCPFDANEQWAERMGWMHKNVTEIQPERPIYERLERLFGLGVDNTCEELTALEEELSQDYQIALRFEASQKKLQALEQLFIAV